MAFVASSFGQVLLQDDFTGSSVNTNNWIVKTDVSGSSVSVSSGYLQLINRGTVLSLNSFMGPISLDSKFQLLNNADSNLKYVLRSNGQRSGTELCGVAVQLQSSTDWSGQIDQIAIFEIGNTNTNAVVAPVFLTSPINLDQWYSVKIVDTQTNIDLYFNGATTPTLSFSSSFTPGNQIAIYNREGGAAGSWISEGGTANVSYVTVASFFDDLSYFAKNLPTDPVFFNSLASNSDFISALASSITSSPSAYGILQQGPQGPAGRNGTNGATGPQGPIGLTGPQGAVGPQGQAGVGSPQNLLTNSAFLQSLATNPVFLTALSQSLTTTNISTNYGIASKAVQMLNFAPIPAQTYKPFKTITLNAASSAKLPVTYSCANPAVGIVISNVLQLQGSGTTTVTASQIGNQYYNPASATQTLIVK